jgi:hypothetical protein
MTLAPAAIAASFSAQSYPTVTYGPRVVAIGDLDNDGHPDLVVTHPIELSLFFGPPSRSTSGTTSGPACSTSRSSTSTQTTRSTSSS